MGDWLKLVSGSIVDQRVLSLGWGKGKEQYGARGNSASNRKSLLAEAFLLRRLPGVRSRCPSAV